eukprot:8010432-Pyramimonas_sp.AAC.1
MHRNYREHLKERKQTQPSMRRKSVEVQHKSPGRTRASFGSGMSSYRRIWKKTSVLQNALRGFGPFDVSRRGARADTETICPEKLPLLR